MSQWDVSSGADDMFDSILMAEERWVLLFIPMLANLKRWTVFVGQYLLGSLSPFRYCNTAYQTITTIAGGPDRRAPRISWRFSPIASAIVNNEPLSWSRRNHFSSKFSSAARERTRTGSCSRSRSGDLLNWCSDSAPQLVLSVSSMDVEDVHKGHTWASTPSSSSLWRNNNVMSDIFVDGVFFDIKWA